MDFPNLDDVYRAEKTVEGVIRKTPLIESEELSRRTDALSVKLKLESLQYTGSFKVRGASNKILSLSDKERQRGIATFSTGNHGKAVSYVSGKAGIKAVVCLSENVPAYRVEMIRSLGAKVLVTGNSQDEAENKYKELVDRENLVPVVPFDDPAIIAGQGTITLEILREDPEVEVLLVPVSGGGLISGVGMVAKSINPKIHIVGVSIEKSPVMLQSLRKGKPVSIDEEFTLADSLLGGIGEENAYTLEMAKRYVDEHIVVSEEDIARGMYYIFNNHRLVIEGAAAVGVGAVLSEKISLRDKKAAILITGSTIDEKPYISILNEYSR